MSTLTVLYLVLRHTDSLGVGGVGGSQVPTEQVTGQVLLVLVCYNLKDFFSKMVSMPKIK